MSDFKRETRYFVVKIADIETAKANGNWSPEMNTMFHDLLDVISHARFQRGKEPLECVVVENDWRCFETVWDLVEAEHIVNDSHKQPEVQET